MISSINSIFYPTLCAKLVSALPSVNFNFEESNIQNIFQKVNSSATNIGLTVLNETMQKNIADNTNLSFISLKTCKLVAYCSNESPFKKYHSISIKTLLKLPLIDYKIGGEQISPVTELCAEYGTPNFVLQTSNINTFYTLLNEGKYLSIGVDTLSGMKNFSIIPTRESFNLTMGILVQPGYLQSPIMNAVTQTIINIQSKKI